MDKHCNCALCDEFHQLNKEPIKEYFYDSRIFAFNEHICLFPTIGSFVKGYILLSTIKHYISLYECPDNVIDNVKSIVNLLRHSYKDKMNSEMIFFEHGTIDSKELSSASVSHFHMHFLPVKKEKIWDIIDNQYHFKHYVIKDLKEIKEIIDKYKFKSYLLFGDTDGSIYLIDSSSGEYPSQFFRIVFYNYYYPDSKDNGWNWKKFPFQENMSKTIELFKDIKI